MIATASYTAAPTRYTPSIRVERLKTSMEWNRRTLMVFREKRMEALRQYVGKHYSNDGASDKVPVNLLEMAINIYVRQIAANAPRPMVATTHEVLKPQAATFELALMQLIDEIDFGTTIRGVVLDAMFSIGLLKVGITGGAQAELDGFLHDAGQAFADQVMLDDWIQDMTVKRWEQVCYCGDRYTLPYEEVMDFPHFNRRLRDKLQPTPKKATNEDSGDERAESISQGSGAEDGEYKDMVALWDLWFPRDNVIITVPAEGEWSEPLHEVEWDGYERGPYHRLTFSDVPGNVMPLAPVALMRDLHELANNIFRKLGRQVQRQKTVLGVRGAATDDGNRIVQANDGDTITVDDPGGAKEYNYGGPNAESLAFLLQVKDLFVYLGGNLDTLGGLSPQAETLGQDRLLAANASQRIYEMQDRVVGFTRGALRSMAWYEWTEPVRERQLLKEVGGTGISVPVVWSPETREGDFLDFNFSIDAYSMQHQTPASKLQAFGTALRDYIIPLMPVLQPQGVTIDGQAIVEFIAKYAHLPEIASILITGTPPQLAPGGPQGDPAPRLSAQTTRRYERVNRPGATRAGNDNALAQLLMGGKLQSGRAAALGRPPS